MSKVVIAAAAALAMAGTASAEFISAPSGGSAELELQITGTVPEICGLTAASSTLEFDYGDLARNDTTLPGGFNFGIVCNSAAGAILSVSSAGNGYMLRNGSETGPGNQIPYTFDLDKGGDEFSYYLGTRPMHLDMPYDFIISGSNALRQGREVGAYVVVDGVKGPDFNGAPTTTVFAGDYSDVITLSLSAQ
ncbi:hypothetical protein WNY37_17250 [Henriciella sp. AS95]|uniref:hypothetical protein n=1 Tax=Henriciella sp. AS95 TaxID=3135782 RepID=UPI00316BB4E2